MDPAAAAPEARILALLQLIERDRDERIRDTEQRAAALAHEIIQHARRDATRRVREAAHQARDDARRRLEAARAELSTRDRERDRELAVSLLERAWQKLVAELERRWQDSEQRVHWVAALIEQAAATLPRTNWLIEHPLDFGAPELDALVRKTADRTSIKPATRGDPALKAGLRVIAGGTKLDGSIDGLLARRDLVESRLLGRLFRDGGVEEAP